VEASRDSFEPYLVRYDSEMLLTQWKEKFSRIEIWIQKGKISVKNLFYLVFFCFSDFRLYEMMRIRIYEYHWDQYVSSKFIDKIRRIIIKIH